MFACAADGACRGGRHRRDHARRALGRSAAPAAGARRRNRGADAPLHPRHLQGGGAVVGGGGRLPDQQSEHQRVRRRRPAHLRLHRPVATGEDAERGHRRAGARGRPHLRRPPRPHEQPDGQGVKHGDHRHAAWGGGDGGRRNGRRRAAGRPGGDDGQPVAGPAFASLLRPRPGSLGRPGGGALSRQDRAVRQGDARPVPDARQPVSGVVAQRQPLRAVAPDAARPHPQPRGHRHEEPELRKEGFAGAGAAPPADAGEAVRLPQLGAGGLPEVSEVGRLAARPLCARHRRHADRRPEERDPGNRHADQGDPAEPLLLGAEGPGAAGRRAAGGRGGATEAGAEASAQQRAHQHDAGAGPARQRKPRKRSRCA